MSRYRQTMIEALEKVYKKEDKDHEISMARGELEAIADKATQLASALQGKSDEGNPLEAWVQSKITKAKDYINSVSDYLMYNPDMAKEETILEKSFTSQQIKQAYGILNDPRYKGGNYDGAVKAIEKLAKGLSNHPDVANALKRANEELEEGKIKDIFTANKEGESIEQIAKRLNMSVATVKKVLGEEVIDEKIADSIIKDLQKSYGDLKGKTISPEMATKISKHLDGQSFDVVTLRQLMKADIPFISTLARNKIYKKTGKFEEVELDEVKTPALEPDKRSDGEKDIDKIKLAKGLSKQKDVANALKRANEEFELDEGKIKDIFTANKEGESIDNIAKRLKMSANDVKKILGEETLDEKVADSIIKDLQKAYAPLKGKTISPEMANKMSKHLDGQSFDVVTLRQLMKAQIPFISTLARNKIYKKTGKFEEITEATPGMKDDPSDKSISDKDTSK